MKARGAAPLATALVATLFGTVQAAPQATIRLVETASAAGLDFVHRHGGAGERYMVETMGAGLAAIDVDRDGRIDLYFAQGAATPGVRLPDPVPANALYRAHPDGRFRRASTSGAESAAYSMGVTAADYDNDGWPDLFVSNFGRSELFRNNGDGTFLAVTAAAGIDHEAWSVSAAWADVDDDGRLDLYVANYVDFAWNNHKFCGNPRRNLRAYCHPDVYSAVPDLLYRNRGDGTFGERGAAAGIADALDGKGLGVVFGDYDDDGDADAYVANDSTRNFLYTNQGDGTFVEDGLLAGVAFSADGQAEAGMGTDWGDYDGDGRLDVVVTNLDLETNSLYRNLGEASFVDSTSEAGLGEPSLRFVGFGANWVDLDNDGDLDLFVANGHIIDNIADFRDNISYAQPNHVYRNGGDGRFHRSVAPEGLGGTATTRVSRGSIAADLDGDGDQDVVVSNNNQPPELLRNDSATTGGAVQLRLIGRTVNRSGVGARVQATAAGRAALVRELTAGNSYASSGPDIVHLGIGDAAYVIVSVRWPGGAIEPLGELASGHAYVIQEGRGVTASRPFRTG